MSGEQTASPAGLDLKTRARFDWSIEQLRVRNVAAREPLARHLEGKLWEVHRGSGTKVHEVASG